MKKLIITTIVSIITIFTFAQNVGVGTNNPKELSKLDIESSTSGLLLPRMTSAQRATLGSNVSTLGPALSEDYNGLMVYDTDNNTLYMWDSNKTDFTNGGWNNILDADASLADNDDDSSNEYNNSLAYDATTGNLTVNDGGGNKTANLNELKDHDWYEVGQTKGADNISDNIYTNGNVGIGSTNPTEKLEVYPNTENSAQIGRVHIGTVGHNNWAGFSHVNTSNTESYALLQNANGRTLINSAAGETIQFKNDNNLQFEMEADGDLTMLGDNSIKMPNNIVWAEDRGAASYNNNDSYRGGSYTANMNVESGNVIKLDATSLLRLTNGSGDDDFYIRVFIDGSNGCPDSYSEELGWIRHSEDGSDHDNFRTYSYMDVVNVSCTGSMRFRLEIRNTGDDSWQRQDAILTAIKF